MHNQLNMKTQPLNLRKKTILHLISLMQPKQHILKGQMWFLRGSAASRGRHKIKHDVSSAAASACKSARVHFPMNSISRDALFGTNYKTPRRPYCACA